MNKSRLVTTVTICLLAAGCGKTIPDCSDPRVTNLVEGVMKGNVKNIAAARKEALQNLFPGMATIEVEVSISEHKLDAISTVGVNKDSGIATCKAMRHANVHASTIIKPIADNAAVVVMIMTELQKFTAEDKKEMGNLNETLSKETNSFYFNKLGTIDDLITYTAQLTDKGDQVLVEITNSTSK